MDHVLQFFQQLDNLVWGAPLLVLLVGTGIYLTLRLGLLQIRYLPKAFRLIFTEDEGHGDISSFGALATALAATVGTGNIVGVATAIQTGGPGALFWMWMAAFFGMATKYAEGLLAIRYRTKDDNGHLIVEPDEAEIVKRIYREYLEGKSLKQIGDGLMKDGILTAAKKPTWRPEAIKKILQNEKYIGDALLQKTYTVDVLTKKRVKNNGIMPQYYVENNHEAIIPRDLYMQAQEELLRRANLHSGANRKKRVYSSKYALSSICYCPRCGDIYQRIKSTQTASWKCATRFEKGSTACDAPLVPERDLHNAVLRGINMVLSSRN